MIVSIIYTSMVIYYTLGIRFLLGDSWEDSIYCGIIWPVWAYSEMKKILIKWVH